MAPPLAISTGSLNSNIYVKKEAAPVEEAIGSLLGHSEHTVIAQTGHEYAGETGIVSSKPDSVISVIESTPCELDVLHPLIADSIQGSFSYSIVSEKPMCVDLNGKERSYGECWTQKNDLCQVCTCYNMQDVRCEARQCDAEPVCTSGQRKELQSDDGCCKSYRCVESKIH